MLYGTETTTIPVGTTDAVATITIFEFDETVAIKLNGTNVTTEAGAITGLNQSSGSSTVVGAYEINVY